MVKNIKKYWLPDLPSASMGDIFREKAKTDPEIKELTEKGILIDDSVTDGLFREFALGHMPGLIDGFPRNRQQTLDAIKFVKEQGWRVLVIDLQCDLETIIERLLSRGREDDKLSIMHKRNTDHKRLHPAVMQEIKMRADLFDVITLNGNLGMEETFTNFLLDILRLVDMLHFYDLGKQLTEFQVHETETSVNPAINRMLCRLLMDIQEKINKE